MVLKLRPFSLDVRASSHSVPPLRLFSCVRASLTQTLPCRSLPARASSGLRAAEATVATP